MRQVTSLADSTQSLATERLTTEKLPTSLHLPSRFRSTEARAAVSVRDHEAAIDALQLARCSTARARRVIPRDKALQWQVLPLALSVGFAGDEILSVVTVAERTAEIYQVLRFVFAGEIQIEKVSAELDLLGAIKSAYDGDISVVEQAAHQAERADISEGAISKLVQAVFDRAHAINASDIHLAPFCASDPSPNHPDSGFRLLYRVDGSLRAAGQLDLSKDLGGAFIRRLKVLASLDLTVNHEPQEGACVVGLGKEMTRIRLSIVPTVGGPKVALRLLKGAKESKSRDFAQLGLAPAQERVLKTALGLGGGVILCVGPTGSGKSTLLHSVMTYLRRPGLHLVAIEDPVERLLSGISQCEINEQRGVTYRSLLKAMLRQDPDVIMVGEIRDRETAELAFTAGLSGHLILSTLHASSCLEAFSRLSQLGVSAELSSLALRLIVSQRLLPLNCTCCGNSSPVAPLLANYLRLDGAAEVTTSNGCSQCENTGYCGRVGVFELLMCTDNVKRAARAFATDHDAMRFREVMHEEQYEPYSWRVREALIDGRISPRAALEVLGLNPEIFGY